ncbi:MAG: hypothetical protein HC796_10870 [Synechococcaceae cyanobacterium RL_1_2]|nr:hypothetical protein [Synechococcaceae cyanobacterium RL_1_2]
MDFSYILPPLFVTLREGFEAALVVGIVLACLKKADRSDLNRWVWLGVMAGILTSMALGLGIVSWLQSVNDRPLAKEMLEGSLALAAIAMLSWMLIWMTRQAKSLKREVETEIKARLSNSGARAGIFLLVFIAVVREGLETVVFIAAQFNYGWVSPAIGASLGLAGATILATLLFRWGVRINLQIFFQVMGVILLVIVGGLVIGFIRHLDSGLGLWATVSPYNICSDIADNGTCIMGLQIWNAQHILPDREFPGIIFKTLFGYRQEFYYLQLLTYTIFMSLVGGLYLKSLKS